MLEHACQVSAINPAIAGRTPDEMLGLVRDRLADALAPVRAVCRGWSCLHSSDIEPGVIEQRKMNLPAHVGNVGVVEQQLGCTAPALATLCLLVRQ